MVAVYSWAGGVGRTQLTANVGLLLAQRGLRVGLVDAALTTPALHVPYRIDISGRRSSLASLLLGECELDDVLHDVTPQIDLPIPVDAALFVVPGYVSNTAEVEVALAHDFDLGLLTDALRGLSSSYSLDIVLIDTQNGLNAPALLAMLMADLSILVCTSDRREGCGAKLLESLRVRSDAMPLVLSVSSDGGDEMDAVSALHRKKVDVALPHSTGMASLHDGLLVLVNPDDPLAQAYGALANIIIRSLGLSSS